MVDYLSHYNRSICQLVPACGHYLDHVNATLQMWITEYTAEISAQRNTIEQPSQDHRSVPNLSPDGSVYTAVIV